METLIFVNTAFSAVGSLSCILAIVLILSVKAYHSFVYRLMLYLAFVTLCLEATIGLQALPIEYVTFDNESGAGIYDVRRGWGGICTGIAYAYQTLWFVQVFTIAWICVYIFALSVLNVALKERNHQVAGICCVILLPLLISWIPFVNQRYGFTRRSYVCWIIDACTDSDIMVGHLMQLFISSLPAALVLAIGLGLLCTVAIKFCKRFGHRYLWPQHKMALKEISPLLTYAIFNCVVTILGCVLHMYMMGEMTGHSLHPAEIGLISSCLFQSLTIILPLVVLFHPSYWKKTISKLHLLLGKSKLTSTNTTTTVRHETKREASEKDPLIKNSVA